jgi:hypothetical protein
LPRSIWASEARLAVADSAWFGFDTVLAWRRHDAKVWIVELVLVTRGSPGKKLWSPTCGSPTICPRLSRGGLPLRATRRLFPSPTDQRGERRRVLGEGDGDSGTQTGSLIDAGLSITTNPKRAA